MKPLVSTTKQAKPNKVITKMNNTNQIYFHHAGLTNTGMIRDHNEDAYRLPIESDTDSLDDKGYLYVLADGMGGHQKGEVASNVTIDVVNSEYYSVVNSLNGKNTKDDIDKALRHAIKEANKKVMIATEGGGTTVVSTVLHKNLLVMMNVGDSRAYLFRNDRLRFISRDHSLVSRLVEMGKITEEEALTHPRRNVLYQALGQELDIEIHVFSEKIEHNDLIILCSDGLWGEIGEKNMTKILQSANSPLSAIENMIDSANSSGGADNITAIIIKVSNKKPPEDTDIGIVRFPPTIYVEEETNQTDEETHPSITINNYQKPETLPEGKYYVEKKQEE